jgi:hypothetical protein
MRKQRRRQLAGPAQAAAIPAKAGIHSANLHECSDFGMDSRFRGNDCGLERDSIPNGAGKATKQPK